MPLYLTEDEQAELDRQNALAEHSRYHDELKCAAKLELRFYFKRHTRFHRQFCITHQVLVSMSGWEIGFEGGSDSRAMVQK
jgi:hypothetical protein